MAPHKKRQPSVPVALPQVNRFMPLTGNSIDVPRPLQTRSGTRITPDTPVTTIGGREEVARRKYFPKPPARNDRVKPERKPIPVIQAPTDTEMPQGYRCKTETFNSNSFFRGEMKSLTSAQRDRVEELVQRREFEIEKLRIDRSSLQRRLAQTEFSHR
jgi:hypothetical protein